MPGKRIGLDELDISILKEIEENPLTSKREIGRKLDTPDTTVHLRIKRMKNLGLFTLDYSTIYSTIMHEEDISRKLDQLITVLKSKVKHQDIVIEKLNARLLKIEEKYRFIFE